MSDEPPHPLTAPDCDLRGLPYLPLDVQRFRDSDLVTLEPPEVVVAAITLWCAAWHDVPAGSLPDDDRILARLTGYGRSIGKWAKIRAGALHGFVRCSDGRLYHRVLASKACHAWAERLKHRHAQFRNTIAQHNKRDREDEGGRDELRPPTFDEWEALGRPKTISEFKAAVMHDNGQCHDDIIGDSGPKGSEGK